MNEGGDKTVGGSRATADKATTCPQNASLLALQAGGDVSPRQAALLRRHLDGCAACRKMLAELRDTRDWVRVNLPVVDADVLTELRRRVVGGLSRERPFPWLFAMLARAWVSWRNLGWQPVRGPAVAALLVVGALGALPSLNGRLMQPGPFSALPPAHDARPAVAHASSDETDEGETAETEEAADSETVLGLEGLLDDPPSDPSGLRIEMQTGDPNVRIIWFASNTDRGP